MIPYSTLNFSKFPFLSCGLRSPWRHTQENSLPKTVWTQIANLLTQSSQSIACSNNKQVIWKGLITLKRDSNQIYWVSHNETCRDNPITDIMENHNFTRLVNILLKGSTTLSLEVNTRVQHVVCTFIADTARFSQEKSIFFFFFFGRKMKKTKNCFANNKLMARQLWPGQSALKTPLTQLALYHS